MRNNEFMRALNALCVERNLSKEVVFDAIESALQAAYRRDFEHDPNVTVLMDRTTGAASVYIEKNVVEYVQYRHNEISLEDARRIYGSNTQIGDVVREEQTPRNFGRIAAQTAKQVILQRIREAERDRLYHDYASREGELVMGIVQNIDHKTRDVRLSLGKVEAVLPHSEQLPNERYRIGQRVQSYVAEVNRAHRGPQITVSRTHRKMLRRLLELEVPEITNGTVELRAIAREAGARSKVAVAALQPNIDPVGACVGMKGIRIQNIVNELNGEKIDIVQWSPDDTIYVANALSPAKVMNVFLKEDHNEGKTATVVVPDKQLSLAIGKEGQNARLAAKLTGWRIDIKSSTEASQERVRQTDRRAVGHKQKSRSELEEEARLAAARALLAGAGAMDSLFDDEEDEFSSMGEVDEMAFGDELDLFDQDQQIDEVAPFGEEEDDVMLADDEDDVVLAEEEDDVVLAEEEDDVVLAEEEDDVVLTEEEDGVVLADDEDEVLLFDAPSPSKKTRAVDASLTTKEDDAKTSKDLTKIFAEHLDHYPPPEANRSKLGSRSRVKESDLAEEDSKSKSESTIFYTFNARGEALSLDSLLERKERGNKKKKKKKRKERRNRGF